MKKLKRSWDFVDWVTATGLVWIVGWVLMVGGWIANIIKLIGVDFAGHVTVEIILRLVGVIAFPLGAIMGYL